MVVASIVVFMAEAAHWSEEQGARVVHTAPGVDQIDAMREALHGLKEHIAHGTHPPAAKLKVEA